MGYDMVSLIEESTNKVSEKSEVIVIIPRRLNS